MSLHANAEIRDPVMILLTLDMLVRSSSGISIGLDWIGLGVLDDGYDCRLKMCGFSMQFTKRKNQSLCTTTASTCWRSSFYLYVE